MNSGDVNLLGGNVIFFFQSKQSSQSFVAVSNSTEYYEFWSDST